MVGHPWAQYYAAALSFVMFGESAWAARAPFAAAAVATVIVVYWIVWRATLRRPAAVTAAGLLVCSVQFLVYARQARHYSLAALLVCLLIAQFFRLRSWPQTIVFALLTMLQFHVHPSGLAPLAAMAVLTIVSPRFAEYRRWYWPSVPLSALGILPWLWLTRAALSINTAGPNSAAIFGARLAQFAVECASVTPVIGTCAIALWLAIRRDRSRGADAGFPAGTAALAWVCAGALAAYGLLVAATQSRDQIWEDGVRQTAAVLPIVAMLAALAIAAASKTRRRTWLVLAAIFAFTTLPRVTPWTSWADPSIEWTGASAVAFHRPLRLVDRWLRTSQVAFARGLWTPNPGTLAAVCDFLDRRAGDHDVILTNYEWEPLYFHTHLPQALKVLPTFPVYSAARERQLPDYVFFADRARWVIVRRVWGTYGGQDLDRVLDAMSARGYRVTLAATIPETVWENRENIHFRRFPNGRYFYPWYGALPDARIYKVEPPAS